MSSTNRAVYQELDSMINIVLVGFMGTGKTTIGKLLSQRLNRGFFDIDQLIEEKCGMIVNDIFAEHGEAFFREQEKLIIRKTFSQINNIVSTGGGAVLSSENVDNMKKQGFMICLTATADVIVKRIGMDTTRPLLQVQNKKVAVEKMLEERARRYEMADVIIDTSKLTPEEVVDRIIAILRQ